jgi:hypothetical protein
MSAKKKQVSVQAIGVDTAAGQHDDPGRACHEQRLLAIKLSSILWTSRSSQAIQPPQLQMAHRQGLQVHFPLF